MPWVLRIATFGGLNSGVTALLFALMTVPRIEPSGTLSTAHWETGIRAALLAVGVLMLAVTVGLLRRSKWVRPIIVGLPVLQMVPFTIVYRVTGQLESITPHPKWLLSCGGWALLAGIYLFGTQAARRYFARREVSG